MRWGGVGELRESERLIGYRAVKGECENKKQHRSAAVLLYCAIYKAGVVYQALARLDKQHLPPKGSVHEVP